jgi:hypothetical protein
MADPVTNNYGLVLPVVGSDSGVWGGFLNNGVFTPIDSILGANYSFSVTSADVTLTTTQCQNAIFIVNGTLTANHNVILPFQNNGTSVSTMTAVGGKFVVVNNGAGAYNLSVKTAAANATSGVAIVPQGFVAEVYSDGTNVGYASNGLPGYAAASTGNPNGPLAGTAGSINTNPSLAYDYVNNAFYLCTTTGTAGSAVWSQPAVSVTRGFDTAYNLSFTTSVSANILTVTAVAANTGTTPTLTNPIGFVFGDATIGNGDPVTVNATGVLSISTFTTGASFGATNGTAFRLWITGFNNGGSPVLALRNCSNSAQIFHLNESVLASTVGMSATANLAGVFYTPNGVTLSASAYRILGFLEYSTGLVTVGTYNNPPTAVRLFGPGVKKPGEIVQIVLGVATTGGTAGTGGFVAFGLSQSLSPTSAVNLVRVSGNAVYGAGGASAGAILQKFSRGTGPTFVGPVVPGNIPTLSNLTIPISFYDAPGTTAAIGYPLYFEANSGVVSNGVANSSSTVELWEIMG